jgi:hypothetical protein
MQPIKRKQFICSVIEKCREKVNCCAHKIPHIKDERCIPRECRYAPMGEIVDCDPYDPENPRAPISARVAPVKTVEQRMKEQTISVTVDEATSETLAVLEVKGDTVKHDDSLIPDLIAETATQEIDIKEAVKKQAVTKKKGRKS